jgi:uncharacterized RmlC-like cupin family protein
MPADENTVTNSAAVGNATSEAAKAEPIVLLPGEGETVPSGPNQITFKVAGDATGGSFSLIEYSVVPNFKAPPAYFHTNEIWAAYILEGTLTFQFGERKISAPAGTFILSPRDVPSTWWNESDQPARWLIIFAPPGFEQIYRELDAGLKALPPGPFDLAKAMPILLPIWAKYGVKMV